MNWYLFAHWKEKKNRRAAPFCLSCWAECACVCFAQVQKHLSKLFDNIAKMQFVTDAEGTPTKSSLGMYSKEEEYVPFCQPCDCIGQVKL